jgi:hypothetical protein
MEFQGAQQMTLKYERGQPENWDEGIKFLSASWVKTESSLAYLMTGPCPRCSHPISKDLTDIRGFGFAADSEEIRASVRCNCAMAHQGRPDGVSSGCGAEGAVSIQRPGHD